MKITRRRGPKKKDPELVKVGVGLRFDPWFIALLRAEVKEHGGTQPGIIQECVCKVKGWKGPEFAAEIEGKFVAKTRGDLLVYLTSYIPAGKTSPMTKEQAEDYMASEDARCG